MRGQLRRRARGGRARSPSARRSSRWTRTRSARRSATSARSPSATGTRDAALELDRPPARAHRRRAPSRCAGAERARWRRSSGSTRSSSPATGRRRSSSSPAASTCSASRASTPSESTWETVAAAAPRRGRLHAVRLRRRALRTPRRCASPTRCATVGAERVVAVDASAYFSRPGPRLVDGLELMAHILHPELVELPAGVDDAIEVVIATSAARHPDTRDRVTASRGGPLERCPRRGSRTARGSRR